MLFTPDQRRRVKLALFGLAVGLALTVSGVVAQQNNEPRGDLYSSRAIQALEQCFDSTGAFICAPSGGGTPVGGTGTAGTVARWTAVDTIGDGVLLDDGLDVTLPDNVELMFGNDDDMSVQFQSAVGRVIFSSTDTSTGLVVENNAPNIFRVTDQSINTPNYIFRNFAGSLPASGPLFEVDYDMTTPVMDGGDLLQMVFIDLTNANHTGAGNEIYGMYIDGITPDADATEVAFNIDAGWDQAIALPAAPNAGTENTLIFGADQADQASMFMRDGGFPVFILETDHDADGEGSAFIRIGDNATQGVFIDENTTRLYEFRNSSGAGTDSTFFGIGSTVPIALDAMDGGDATDIIQIRVANANHTGAGNTLDGIDIGGIVGDAEALESAIRIGSGWDYSAAWTVLSASPPNLASNEVGFFIDESTDRVATAAADCALVARLSSGVEINVAILVTDGGCP